MSTAERLRARLDSMKEAAAAAAGTILQTAEVNGVAFGFGVAKAKWGDDDLSLKIAGVDADLLVGVAGHGLAFAGIFAGYDEHVHNMADGALAVWSHAKGLQIGADWKSNAGTSGRRALGAGNRLSPSELLKQRLQARAR